MEKNTQTTPVYTKSTCTQGWKPLKLSFDGSKGVPLKGDPSASQACLSASYCFYSSVVGKPCIFLCC